MPKVIFPVEQRFSALRDKTIILDKAPKEPIVIEDWDGIWVSQDPRILQFCGVKRPGPEALIYKIPETPTELFPLAQKFISEHQNKKGCTGFVRENLSESEQQELMETGGPFLDRVMGDLIKNMPIDWRGNSCFTSMRSIARHAQLQTRPYDTDDQPHIDAPERHMHGFWSLYWTIAGDRGTILSTKNRYFIETFPGEIVVWRQGPHGTYHMAPQAPFNRMTFLTTSFEVCRLAPAAKIVQTWEWEGEARRSSKKIGKTPRNALRP